MKLRFLMIFVFCTAAVAREQTAVAVWDANCIRIGQATTATAPLKDDGTPDLSRVTVHKVVLDMKCWNYEVRH